MGAVSSNTTCNERHADVVPMTSEPGERPFALGGHVEALPQGNPGMLSRLWLRLGCCGTMFQGLLGLLGRGYAALVCAHGR